MVIRLPSTQVQELQMFDLVEKWHESIPPKDSFITQHLSLLRKIINACWNFQKSEYTQLVNVIFLFT